MAHYKNNQFLSGDKFIHQYSGISKADLDKAVHGIMMSSGYTLSEGSEGNGNYTKGSRVLRILFGAFIKYFKFNVYSVSGGPNELMLTVEKLTSGMSGGLIGISQVKTELNRLAMLFQSV